MANTYKRELLVPTFREMNKDLYLESVWFKTRQGPSLLKVRFSPPGKFQESASVMTTEIPLNYFQCIPHQSKYPSTLLTL